MAKYNFRINLDNIESSEIFKEATKEELKILISIIGSDGYVESRTKLSEKVGVSKARILSAITLWEESGVLEKAESKPKQKAEKTDWDSFIPAPVSNSDGKKSEFDEDTRIDVAPEIIDEFSENVLRNRIDEETSLDVAEEIRDSNLQGLINDCAILMGRPSLNTQEIKHITALYKQLALPIEYIMNLAAHLNQNGKLTPKRLSDRANQLVKMGIDTVEQLNDYIKDQEDRPGYELEFNRVVGNYGRSLSKSEKEYFRKWAVDYGYSSVIVGEAYDITVINTGKKSLPYMDKLLKVWHEAGCKTLSDCQTLVAKDRQQMKTEKAKKTTKKTTETKQPKFAEFNTEDAMMKALARSYGEGEEDKK